MIMKGRELAEEIKQHQYFEPVPSHFSKEDEGTREMEPQYPFLISDGTNTERYYFTHINNTTDYNFNIRPEYFGNESNYPEIFPERIKAIIEKNADARIFCVFDVDTVYCNKANQKRHRKFMEDIKDEIDNGSVVLCPSMPSIEYWFLLHYENYTDLIKTCGRKLQDLLSPHMMPYFSSSEKKLLNLLKNKDYISKSDWVQKLCSEGKLDTAIKRAEDNIRAAEASGKLEKQSYSYVYKVFKNNI